MQVLLIQDVEHVGETGRLVNVRDGFARNYLFPRRLAVPATKAARGHAARLEAGAETRRSKRAAEMKALAEKLGGVSCTLPRKAGTDEKLFGSVTAADVAAALTAQGIPVDRRQVVLPESLRALGVHTVPVRLGPDLTPSVKVWIVREAA